MTQEEKFKEAKRLYETANADQRYVLESIFPELKESEDERTRKKIISAIKEDWPGHTDWIAWLEKQAEHKKFRDSIQIGDKVTRNEDGVLVNLSQLNRVAKKQGEQNPAWSEKYIADVFEKVGLAKIVREQSNDNLTIALQSAMIELSKFTPQPKQKWSEEDKNMIRFIGNAITVTDSAEYLKSKHIEVIDAHKWLENLKDRVQPKQEWREEDEDIINKILCICNDFKRSFEISPVSTKVIQKDIDKIDSWLKSLRHQSQWKPSDEQMEFLSDAISYYNSLGYPASKLKELLEDLKKLKGEQL